MSLWAQGAIEDRMAQAMAGVHQGHARSQPRAYQAAVWVGMAGARWPLPLTPSHQPHLSQAGCVRPNLGPGMALTRPRWAASVGAPRGAKGEGRGWR